MDLQAEVKHLRQELRQSEHVQNELDRRVFYLKTLFDVSKDIFSSVESETILRSFLLMAMGNFGTDKGFVVLIDSACNEIQHFVEVGLEEKDVATVKYGIEQISRQDIALQSMSQAAEVLKAEFLSAEFAFVQGFTVNAEWSGIVGLGAKLIGEPYTENDWELVDTLVNNLVVALKNAGSFEKIKKLNLDLEAKNKELKMALEELQAALRKVEILESIKSNLCKFVPTAVTQMVENSTKDGIQEASERDISVLFLDIEGYTKITECVGGTEVNTLVEKYFSVFMDAIYENNGDVVETAGDGLMVLFLTDGDRQHALEAVKTAQTIKEKARHINEQSCHDSQPLVINIGICSGQAFVGAAKFESYTGSRWAYTSHGTTTNVAARLCGQAKGGAVLVSKTTAERVKTHFTFSPLGKFPLKNLMEKVEVYALEE
jgi:class 3 adenylate cyclase